MIKKRKCAFCRHLIHRGGIKFKGSYYHKNCKREMQRRRRSFRQSLIKRAGRQLPKRRKR